MKRRSRHNVGPQKDASDAFPTRVQLQLAQPTEKAPAGDKWLHEIKIDGYRLVAFCDGTDVILRTRSMLDWTNRFPEIRKAVTRLPARRAVLAGEVAALLPNGVSSFGALQEALSSGQTGSLVYYVFRTTVADGECRCGSGC